MQTISMYCKRGFCIESKAHGSHRWHGNLVKTTLIIAWKRMSRWCDDKSIIMIIILHETSTLRKWTDETCDVRECIGKEAHVFLLSSYLTHVPLLSPAITAIPYLFSLSLSSLWVTRTTPHWPLPAVRDLTRDGRLSTGTYDESILKLSKASFRGKMRTHETPSIQLPSPTQPRLGHFPQASQAGRLACRTGVLYYIFSLARTALVWSHKSTKKQAWASSNILSLLRWPKVWPRYERWRVWAPDPSIRTVKNDVKFSSIWSPVFGNKYFKKYPLFFVGFHCIFFCFLSLASCPHDKQL